MDGKDFDIIEISGSLRYRDYWTSFYSQVEGIVFIIDGTDISRLPIVKEHIFTLFKSITTEVPVEILINKYDLEDCASKTSVQNFLELDYLDSKFQWGLSNSIAFNGFGVKESIKSISKKIMSK